ncbi:MAG: hypothetical protein AAF391_05735 [Bacteroidota bacterium]
MADSYHPELEEGELLDEEGRKRHQYIIGILQWISTLGRIDVVYATSSMSRFSNAPKNKHLEAVERILGYLKKYPKKGIVINPTNPQYNNPTYTKATFTEDFGNQYKYFIEDIDPRFPEPLIQTLSTTFSSDSDHAHDKVTGRSITGILGFVGSTPVTARSTRQSCVQTSTFGAELVARCLEAWIRD